MWLIICFILLFIVILGIFRVMWYGKGIIKPDFEKVDMQYHMKKHVSTNWDSPFGRGVYYTCLVMTLLILILILTLWYLFN